jgi:PEP-CTERM motif-containing protein
MFACLACEWFWCSMNVNGFTHKPGRTGMVRLFPLVLTGALLIGMQPLAGGTQTWSTTHAPAFTPAIESTIWQVLKTDTEAQAISNPMIEYLEWRRSLDPTRFTSYHPNLSPALAQLLSSPSLPTNPPSPTAPQVLSNPATPSAAPKVFPPAVPEPSSLLLAAAMTGWGIWWRRRIAQRTAR